jgi:DNA helicase II / ATP-dependent DNA helicase PcrA
LEQIAATYSGRASFLSELTLDPPETSSAEAGPPHLDEDYLVLSTIHSAKGQEWDAVFVLNVIDGCIPSDMAVGSEEQIEEERRLLYVGMTRARLHLAVSWASARTPGGRGNRMPSRFLDRLLPDEARAQPTRPKARRAAHCRECGTPLSTAVEKKRGRCHDCPASYDEELFERLRAWRKARADEDEVPAFVVFTDATLQLIAEQCPTSAAALLRISGVGPAKLERYGDSLLAVVDQV